MTPLELAEARRLVDAASPRPWRYETTWNNAGMALADLDMPGSCTGAKIEMLDADAAFITASRTLVPQLLDLVATLTAERDANAVSAAAGLDGDRVSADGRAVAILRARHKSIIGCGGRTNLVMLRAAAYSAWIAADSVLMTMADDTPPVIFELAIAAKHAAWLTYDALMEQP